MANWVRLCDVGEAPAEGKSVEMDAQGVALCVARTGGTLAAVDNLCPHRAGPLAEGWIEEGKIVCPWHAWAFDLATGICAEEHSQVHVYPLEEREGAVFADLS